MDRVFGFGETIVTPLNEPLKRVVMRMRIFTSQHPHAFFEWLLLFQCVMTADQFH